MDGEPGFAEHGCESKPGKAKTIKLTDYTSIGDSFLWVLSLSAQRKYLASVEAKKTLSCCDKKVSRFSEAKEK